MASSRSKSYNYGSVEISLENCVIPETKLEKTPSVVDGLNNEIETDLRIVGCEYVQTAGILLKLPQVKESSLSKIPFKTACQLPELTVFRVCVNIQVAMATGQVLFQRFFYSKSFVRHDVEVSAFSILLKSSFSCFLISKFCFVLCLANGIPWV